MTRKELLESLSELANFSDDEVAHYEADQALLDYINDPEVTGAWGKIPRWYS